MLDGQSSYNEDIEFAVKAGSAYLKANDNLGFVFNTNSKGGLDTPVQPPTGEVLIKIMDRVSGGFSISSANLAFGQLIDAAIESGRRVVRYKNGEQHITEISPL